MSQARTLWWLSCVTLVASIGAGDSLGAGKPRSSTARSPVSSRDRLDAIARAQVWRPPVAPVGHANLDAAYRHETPLECQFLLAALGGTTPKFDCRLATGEKIRVKYGQTAETHAEVAASRLLAVLGFGADDVVMVPQVLCLGCPLEPFVTSKVAEVASAEPLLSKVLDEDRPRRFEWVSVERKFDAPAIETDTTEGWAMGELDQVDPSKGGATRAHVDALRLMAVFLAHWDNKARNQRLVCLTPGWDRGGRCPDPFLMLQDVGATFGPRKVNLDRWEQTAIWEDRASCTVSMDDLPHDGATFRRVRISEGGRSHLAALLSQLSDGQIVALFTAARFDHMRDLFGEPPPVREWVRVFKAKVAEIQSVRSCPPL